MAWTKVVCSECGDTYKAQIYGKGEIRKWKVENWAGYCDACKQSEKEKFLKQNSSGEMPKIEGSEKQIVWAVKIRNDFMDVFEKTSIEEILQQFISTLEIRYDKKTKPLSENELKSLIYSAHETIFSNTLASYWIDIRDRGISEIIISESVYLLKNGIDSDLSKELEEDVMAEALIRPSNPITETVADIRVVDDEIVVSFPEKVKKFITTVKGHGYRWDGAWKKKLSFRTGETTDRLAEVGHAILANNFCIRVLDSDARAKILSGEFEKEHKRWVVVARKYPDHFFIMFEYGDKMYHKAKKLHGAKYKTPGFIVPMENFEEVKDFAELHGYLFSTGAKDLVSRAEKNKRLALVVDVEEMAGKDYGDENGIPILDVPENVEVADEFKD